MENNSLCSLIDFANNLNDVIEENIKLRREVKRLREIEKEYRDFLSKYVNDANRNIGITLKALLKE
jgi:regulator of replication initiation timing